MGATQHEPTAQRTAALPLGDLSWERFEQFGHDLASGLKGMRPETAHRYGTQGQPQGGIDLTVKHQDGRTWGFSSKRYKQYLPSHVQKHIAETTYTADCRVIMIKGIASPAVRDEIRNHPGWELWDVEDLSQKLRLEMAPETARRIVDHHFGPRWRKAFLGLPAVGAFLPADDYFRNYLNPRRLFHHALPLVGRAQVVSELMGFAEASEKRVAILPGRGGIGKTRVLRELAERYDTAHPERALRLLNEGVPATVDSLDDLPVAPCVIVVDDAHRVSDLGVLGAWLRDHPESKLLLGTRLHGVEYLGSQLARAGFDPTEIVRFPPLTELSKEEVRELARHVLGAEHESLTERLVQASRDCPLVTVVGGRLLVERSVSPELLERDSEFRQAVLNRFRDELLGEITEILPRELCRRLLDLIAALNPIPAEVERFHARLAQFIGSTPSEVGRGLGDLERVGLLLRRGRVLRVTPDVLADHILSAACLTDAGRPTGFADEVFQAFGSDCLSKLLKNLAELDWRVRVAADTGTTLLDDVWNEIRDGFQRGGHRVRSYLLKQLGECAYFVPQRVLELARGAVRSPASAEPEEIWPGLLSYSQTSVLEEIPELLRRCAYTESCLTGCFELLWELRRGAAGDEGTKVAEEAVRVLKGIAKYEPRKPITMNRGVLHAARQWLKRGDAFQGPHSPLDILDELLAKAGEESWFDSHMFHSRAFLVNPTAVAELRRELLSLLEECLQSADLRIVRRAIQSLGKGLQGPYPIYNLSVTPATLQAWEPEQLAILETLAKFVASSPPPVILMEVIRAVQHFARYGRLAAVKQRSREIIGSIGQTFEFRLTRSLLPEAWRWEDFEEEDEEGGTGPAADLDERQRALPEPLAAEFWQRFPTAAEAVAELDRVLSELRPVVNECSATTLVWWLLKARPDASADFAEELLRRPEALVIDCAGIPLLHLRNSSPERFADVASRGLDTGVLAIRRSIGGFCRWHLRSDAGLLDGDPDLIERLLIDGDREVRRCGLSALKWLGRFQPRAALDRALAITLDGDTETAAELCQFADGKWRGIPDSFTTGDWTAFVQKLEPVRHVDHHVAEFLKIARRHVPGDVMGFLLRRICERQGEPYDARRQSPHSTELAIIFEDGPAGEAELHALCDAAFASADVGMADLAELFEAASHGYAERSLKVLEERLSSADAEQFQTGVGLLGEAANTFPFDHPELLERLLERSVDFGEECSAQVEFQLLRITTHGVRHGIPGAPFPEDVAVRDRCQAALRQAPAGSPIVRLFERILATAESSIREAPFEFDVES